jgi:hypothetical protein
MIALLHPVFIHYRFFPRCSPINELTNLSKTMRTYEKEVQDQILKTLTGGHSPLLQQRDSIDSVVDTGINSSLDYGTLENNDFSFPSFVTSKSRDILQHS